MLVVATLFGATACSEDGTVDVPDAGGSAEVACDADNSFSIDNFYDGTFGETVGDTICPRKDADFWRFNMQTQKLARVDLQYNKLSNIQLGVQWWRPSGRCTDAAPGSCTTADDCTGGLSCDILRGCVAGDAPDCFASGGGECQAPSICNLSGEPLPNEVVLENRLTAAPDQHRVVAYFPAFNGGEHFLVVQDQQEVEEDDEFQYELLVTEIDDPDGNEPNNGPTDPTPLANSQTVNAYLSYQLDTDWYVITPGFGTPAVLDIELRSDASNVSDPTWIIYQGDFRLDSVSVEIEGAGANQERVRANTLVLPTTEPIIIEIRNRNTTEGTQTVPAFNPDEAYSLRVDVFEDTDEGLNRDDSPSTANLVTLGAAGATQGSNAQSDTGTIIARNDSDWYKLDAGDFPTPATGDNSLLFARVSAADPATTGFQLIAQFYKPNGTLCSSAVQCPGGRVCAEDIGECLDLWVQRPDPRGAGNPETGGLSPNYLQTMLPIHRSKMGDEPRIYLRVAHDQATTLDIPGFDQTATYSIDLEHLQEPDNGDRGSRDSDFLARPLREDDDLSPNDFNADWRLINTATVTPASGGQPFAQVVPGTVLTPEVCQALPLEAWSGQGGLSNGNFTVSAAGNIYADCADTTTPLDTTSVAFVNGVGSVNVIAPAAPTPLTLTVDGRTYQVSTDPTRALTIEGGGGGAFARAFPIGTPTIFSGTETLRLVFPAILQATEEIIATPSPSPTGAIIACASDFNGSCEGAGITPTGPARCGRDLDTPPGSNTACTLPATAGNDFYAFQLVSDGDSNLVTVEFSSPTDAFDPVKVTFSAFQPASALTQFSDITGFISYDGDQDFFRVDVSGVARAGIDGYLNFPSSDVDLRVTMLRDGRGRVALGFSGENTDVIPCSVASTPSNTCTQDALVNDAFGPQSTGACAYATQGDTVDVWVNDIYSNDYDILNSYEIRFDMRGGCPTPQCNSFTCSQ